MVFTFLYGLIFVEKDQAFFLIFDNKTIFNNICTKI